MNNLIELTISTINCTKIRKHTSKLEKLNSKLTFPFSNKPLLKSRINEEASNLSIQIENGYKSKKFFKLGIIMGNLSSTINNHSKVIYDFNGFYNYPNTPLGIDNDNFIVDIYSRTSFVLIDEEKNIFTIKKFFENYAINLTDNQCVFISSESIEKLKREMLHLVNSLCSKTMKLQNDEKIKYGIYREKMEGFFDTANSLLDYDLKEYCLSGLNIVNFNDLISNTVIKLFKGERLRPFERITIAKLTEKQIFEILNKHIQCNYNNIKLDNYLNNITSINHINGCISFEQHINDERFSSPETDCINKNSNSNIIEVDFVKKIVKK